MIIFSTVFPGIVIVHQSEEIYVENRLMTWGEEVYPIDCILGANRYYIEFRDPYRSRF